MVEWGLAMAVAAVHFLLTVFLVAGAPLVSRSRRLFAWYLAVLAPTAYVNIAGKPCPLTVWEKDLLRAAGETPYRGGFISHYFVEPFYSPGLNASADVVILVLMVCWCLAWLTPAVVSHVRRAGSRVEEAGLRDPATSSLARSLDT